VTGVQTCALPIWENGQESLVSVCPLCTNWQDWLCETFAYWAKEIRPLAIWVEDDWRLHNHGAELGWGGCFCKLHLERFSNVVGEPVTREQVIENILAPGTPHPWRDIWLDLSRDSLLEPARKLAKAVQKANPETRIGLMSSLPDVHSIEGRDWFGLQDAFGPKPAFLIRPHMPPYTEMRAMSTLPSVTRQTLACLRRPIEVYPELENGPRCGLYSKSHTYTIWECMHAAAIGSDGITINHYDMMGNGIALDREFGESLASSKSILNAIVNLGIDDGRAQGVKILFNNNVARYFHGEGPQRSLEELYKPSITWSRTCYILGISHSFTQDIDTLEDGPVAVSGETLRSFSDEEIEVLLSKPLLLDGISTKIMVERGFQDAIEIGRASCRERV